MTGMDAADFRFALTAQADGSIRIEIGHAFGEQHVAELVAAERAVVAALAAQRDRACSATGR